MIMASKVKLTFRGFDLLLEQIKDAGGEIKPATERALLSSAHLLTQEIKTGAQQRGVPTDTLITPNVKWNGNRASVEVGFELGAYDPRNPSSGYLALFKEYGAPSKGGTRKTSKGYNRGAVAADPFIRPALKDNKKKIHAAQKKALERILGGLEQ